jgi:hypothetical protein
MLILVILRHFFKYVPTQNPMFLWHGPSRKTSPKLAFLALFTQIHYEWICVMLSTDGWMDGCMYGCMYGCNKMFCDETTNLPGGVPGLGGRGPPPPPPPPHGWTQSVVVILLYVMLALISVQLNMHMNWVHVHNSFKTKKFNSIENNSVKMHYNGAPPKTSFLWPKLTLISGIMLLLDILNGWRSEKVEEKRVWRCFSSGSMP